MDKRLLIDELCKFNDCKRWELEGRIRQRRQENIDFIQNLPQLENARGHIVYADNLSYKNAKTLKAFQTHRCNANVEQYFFIKHRITLEYPYLPCIVMNGGKGHLYFHPIETLYVNYDVTDIFNSIDLNAE